MAIEDFKAVEIEIANINQFTINNQFAMQGERNGRGLVVNVTNNGVVEPQTGLNLNLGWKHQTAKNKDGEQLQGLDAFAAVDRQTGLFRIEYTSAMMTPGVVDAVIEFITGDSVTRSKPFSIVVNRSPFDETAAESDNSFTTLQAALTKASEFEGKINSVAINKVDKGGASQVTWGMLAQDARENISGDKIAVVGKDSVIEETIADGSVTNPKLARDAVVAEKVLKGQITEEKIVQPLMVKKRGKNLFDKNKVARGYYYNGVTGALTPGVNFAAALIDIQEFEVGTSIMRNGTLTFAVYDQDMNHIGGSAGGGYQYIKEVSAAYLGITIDIDTIDTFQIEVGTVLTSYEAYYDYIDTEEIRDKTLPVAKIKEPVIVGKPGKNLFNKEKAILGYYYSGTTGNLTPNDIFAAYLLDVSEYPTGTKLHQNVNRTYAFYDAEKNFLSGSAGGDYIITLPANCAFIGLSVEQTALDKFQVELGTIETSYEPFREVVTEDLLSEDLIRKINKNADSTLKVLMPSRVYLTVGEEWSIYWRNVIKQWQIFRYGNYSVRLQEVYANGSYGALGEDIGYKWYWTPVAAGTKQVEIRITQNDTQEVIHTIRINLFLVNAKTSSAISKTGLTYGDSFTDGYGVSRFIHDFVTTDSNKTFNMIGLNATGKAGVMDDAWSGRDYSWLYHSPTGPLRDDRPLSDAVWDSGWGKDEPNGWREGQTFHSLTPEQRSHGFTRNEMYNPATKTMDFSYFMAEHMNNQHVDSVVSLYGLNNSTWKAPTQLKSELSTYRSIIRTLVNQVNAYDPNIKIFLGTVTPQDDNDAFMRSYGNTFLTDQRAKTAVEVWNEFLIDEFDTAEMGARNVYVMPTHAHFDTRYGLLMKEIRPVKFNQTIVETVKSDVHPTEIGSKYIADTVRNYINGVVF